MGKAVLLIVGTLAYLATLQIERDTAMHQMLSLQKLYTSASLQAGDISATNR